MFFFQGIKWIKNKYGKKLTVLRLGQKFFMDKVELCVAEGRTLLLENLCEEIDPVLDPLLGRNLIKKGKAIKLGDKGQIVSEYLFLPAKKFDKFLP